MFSMWALTMKFFCDYPIGAILLDWYISFKRGLLFLWAWFFLLCLVFFNFFSKKVVYFIKKCHDGTW